MFEKETIKNTTKNIYHIKTKIYISIASSWARSQPERKHWKNKNLRERMVKEEETKYEEEAPKKRRAPKREHFPFFNSPRRELREISNRESLPLNELFD